jgi:O-antigen ligase
MSSLAGEPRHFAAVLALSLMLQQYLKSTGIKIRFISSSYSSLMSLFIFSGILFSFSSSGLLALVIGFGIYLFFIDRVKVLMLAILSVLVVVFLTENTIIGNILWKLSSVDMMLYAVKKDAFALQAIMHNWGHFMLGYGMNLADIYVPDYYLIQQTPFGLVNRYLEEAPMAGAIAPTSAILQIMLNGGIIGTLLVFGFFYLEIRFCRRNTKFIIISILGMTAVSSTLIFSMAVFFFAIMIHYEKKSAP